MAAMARSRSTSAPGNCPQTRSRTGKSRETRCSSACRTGISQFASSLLLLLIRFDSPVTPSGGMTAQLRAPAQFRVLARLARLEGRALRLERPRGEPPVMRARRLLLRALRRESPREAAVARGERGADRRELHQVALRMAAADAVRAAAD